MARLLDIQETRGEVRRGKQGNGHFWTAGYRRGLKILSGNDNLMSYVREAGVKPYSDSGRAGVADSADLPPSKSKQGVRPRFRTHPDFCNRTNPQQPRIIVKWQSSPVPRQVEVAGTFTREPWNEQIALRPCPVSRMFWCDLLEHIPDLQGSHQYKFVVDGEWKCDPTVPICDDGSTHKNLNNFISVLRRPIREQVVSNRKKMISRIQKNVAARASTLDLASDCASSCRRTVDVPIAAPQLLRRQEVSGLQPPMNFPIFKDIDNEDGTEGFIPAVTKNCGSRDKLVRRGTQFGIQRIQRLGLGLTPTTSEHSLLTISNLDNYIENRKVVRSPNFDSDKMVENRVRDNLDDSELLTDNHSVKTFRTNYSFPDIGKNERRADFFGALHDKNKSELEDGDSGEIVSYHHRRGGVDRRFSAFNVKNESLGNLAQRLSQDESNKEKTKNEEQKQTTSSDRRGEIATTTDSVALSSYYRSYNYPGHWREMLHGSDIFLELEMPESVIISKDNLQLSSGQYRVSHDVSARCADITFVSDSYGGSIGVADGVTEWASFGIRPDFFPFELVDNLRRILDTKERLSSREEMFTFMKKALQAAYQNCRCIGSSTISFATMNATRDRLYSCNLGDSGVLVLRKRRGKYFVFYRTSPMQHSWNMPFQLAKYPSSQESNQLMLMGYVKLGRLMDVKRSEHGGQIPMDMPDQASVDEADIMEGDLVICASDGVFDNLFEHEVADIANNFISPQEAAVLHDLSLATDADAIAIAVVEAASHKINDPQAKTPFSTAFITKGVQRLGGKNDDICVACAWVITGGEVSTITKKCFPSQGLNKYQERPATKCS